MKPEINHMICDSAKQIERDFWDSFENESAELPDNDDGFKIEILIAQLAIISTSITFLSRFSGENRKEMMINLLENIIENEELITD